MTSIATPPDLTSEQQATLDRVMKGEAVCLVNKYRIEQVTKNGHTDEADANEPVNRLPKMVREEINAVLEDLMLPRETGIPLAYKRMAKAAAMLLAGMDRIAPELARLQRERRTPDLFAEKDPE
jgi:hypothetical protein